jgi:serine protease Do
MSNKLGLPFLVLIGSAAGGVFAVWVLQNGTPANAQTSPLPSPPPPDAASVGVSPQFEGIVGKIVPSVVAVDAIKPRAESASNKGKPSEESGSGVLTNLDGVSGVYVITNNHVVSGAKAAEITVTLHDGRVLRPTRAWADPESDVAVLAIQAQNLQPAQLGDSDRVRVGQWVLAFGSPFGLNQTVTHGIISARDRGQISLGNTIRIKEFLQTDAAINPGSSGGPLVALDGKVVGINTAIASNSGSNSGVAFSIPINLVKRVGRELLEKGAVSRGYIGVQLAPVIDANEALKLGLERIRGALVEGVHPNSPAAVAGLTQGDVILKLESVELRDENHLINLISYMPANQRVRLGVWRERKLQVVEVTVGDWTAIQARGR